MTARGSSRPVVKRGRGRGKSVIERQLQLMAAKPLRGRVATQMIVDDPFLPGCATCGALLCDCTDRHWKGGGDALAS